MERLKRMGKRQTPQPKSAEFTAKEITSGLKKLDRRIKELESFDVNIIERRDNEECVTLVKKINLTIADIFGVDSNEYKVYATRSLIRSPDVYEKRKHRETGYSLKETREFYQDGIDDAITKLRSLVDILKEKLEDLEEEGISPQSPRSHNSSLSESKRIFVVHGHDEAAENAVARFIESIELEAIILHDQNNQGLTTIEKFEKETDDLCFAVVLLTPDDIGRSIKSSEEEKHRARQNVIFELGYLFGKLGRDRVCILHKENVEIPSNYHGIVYVPMNDQEGWKLKLAKEIKAAGIDIDMNKLS